MDSQSQTTPTLPTTPSPTPATAPVSPTSDLTSDENKVLKQGRNQDELRALQEGTVNTNRNLQQSIAPRYPVWPTSKPGPQATPPPPGMRPINPIRAEQVAEVGYNQATGEPSTQDPQRAFPDEAQGPTGTDQQETAQDLLKKRKQRL